MKLLNKSGYSLIEVMVVLAIVAIIAMLASTGRTMLTNVTTRVEIDKLYALCQYAQHYAMASNEIQTITFNIPANSYRFLDHEEQLSSHVSFGILPGVQGPPAHPTSALAQPITFTQEHITFYPDGIIQAGTLYLVNDTKSTMYALSNAVSQVSHLRRYVYNGSWRMIR